MIAVQIGIAVLGVAAVWLSQDRREGRRKWAPVLGLAGQPLWALEMWSAEQYVLLPLCAFYGAAWWRGFRQHWLKRAAA